MQVAACESPRQGKKRISACENPGIAYPHMKFETFPKKEGRFGPCILEGTQILSDAS
jgi:hypothetical protein